MADEPKRRSKFDQEAEEPVRRSKFDQEAEAPRKSKFDADAEPARKSKFDQDGDDRSPVAQNDKSGRARSRSPEPGRATSVSAAQAAAARIAARINAQAQQQKAESPTSSSSARPAPSSAALISLTPAADSNKLGAEAYEQDGDFIMDIEINDLHNRYTLTKGTTQKTIKEETGADVTTRGEYYPDKIKATPGKPPLYLHVTHTTKEGLEKAIKMIEDLKSQELPNLIDPARFRRRDAPPQFERDERGRRKWPEARVPVDLEPIHGFNLRAAVVGTSGNNVKWIQSETGCKVQIKGRGSGFLEHDTNQESEENMYLHITSPDEASIPEGVKLAGELLDSVRNNYMEHKERRTRGDDGRGNSRGGFGGGRRERDGYGGNHNTEQYSNQSVDAYHGYQNGGAYGDAQAAAGEQPAAYGYNTADTGAMDAQSYAQWAQYYAAYPDQDPYKEQGGFAAVMQAYFSGAYGTQATPAQAATPGQYGNGQQAPTANSQNGGSYNAVPPPLDL